MRPTLTAGGLSPRLRGNHTGNAGSFDLGGSIPAPAGEPYQRPVGDVASRVYPRACGGTEESMHPFKAPHGLSPRLRGNRVETVGPILKGRSIPAPAGEPWWTTWARIRPPVYPRACGGTYDRRTGEWTGQGLSPRLRGNLGRAAMAAEVQGSIPAPAGEPRLTAARWWQKRVYPRACGGTQ